VLRADARHDGEELAPLSGRGGPAAMAGSISPPEYGNDIVGRTETLTGASLKP